MMKTIFAAVLAFAAVAGAAVTDVVTDGRTGATNEFTDAGVRFRRHGATRSSDFNVTSVTGAIAEVDARRKAADDALESRIGSRLGGYVPLTSVSGGDLASAPDGSLPTAQSVRSALSAVSGSVDAVGPAVTAAVNAASAELRTEIAGAAGALDGKMAAGFAAMSNGVESLVVGYMDTLGTNVAYKLAFDGTSREYIDGRGAVWRRYGAPVVKSWTTGDAVTSFTSAYIFPTAEESIDETGIAYADYATNQSYRTYPLAWDNGSWILVWGRNRDSYIGSGYPWEDVPNARWSLIEKEHDLRERCPASQIRYYAVSGDYETLPFNKQVEWNSSTITFRYESDITYGVRWKVPLELKDARITGGPVYIPEITTNYVTSVVTNFVTDIYTSGAEVVTNRSAVVSTVTNIGSATVWLVLDHSGAMSGNVTWGLNVPFYVYPEDATRPVQVGRLATEERAAEVADVSVKAALDLMFQWDYTGAEWDGNSGYIVDPYINGTVDYSAMVVTNVRFEVTRTGEHRYPVAILDVWDRDAGDYHLQDVMFPFQPCAFRMLPNGDEIALAGTWWEYDLGEDWEETHPDATQRYFGLYIDGTLSYRTLDVNEIPFKSDLPGIITNVVAEAGITATGPAAPEASRSVVEYGPWRVTAASNPVLLDFMWEEAGGWGSVNLEYDAGEGAWHVTGAPGHDGSGVGDWYLYEAYKEGDPGDTQVVFDQMYENVDGDSYVSVTFTRSADLIAKEGEPFVTPAHLKAGYRPLTNTVASVDGYDRRERGSLEQDSGIRSMECADPVVLQALYAQRASLDMWVDWFADRSAWVLIGLPSIPGYSHSFTTIYDVWASVAYGTDRNDAVITFPGYEGSADIIVRRPMDLMARAGESFATHVAITNEIAISRRGAVTLGGPRKEGAVGTGSFAQGTNIVASGDFASAQGDNTLASGYAAHTEGTATVASGRAAHAEGCTTVASGNCAHTEGRYTKATGTYSHASGVSSVASNDHSFVWSANLPASNPNNDANKYGSHGTGTFNVNPDGGAKGFYVGNDSLVKVITDNASGMFTAMQMYGIDAAAEDYVTRIEYADGSVEERLVASTFPPLTKRAVSVKIGRLTRQIDQAAFLNQTSLKSVTLSEDLVTIGPYAFMSSSLGGLELPSTVTAIWADAFADSSLTNVTFVGKTLDEVRAMANYPWGLPETAFSARKTATETWVKDLMDTAADGIRGEVDAKVSEAFAGNSPFRTETSTLVGFSDGSYGQFDWSGSVTHDVVVSAGLKNPDYTWARELTSISFGTAVTDVGVDAFSYSPTLTNVVVGTSVATLQEFAFGSHPDLEPTFALREVSIPPSVTGIGMFALGFSSSRTPIPKVLFYGRTEDGLPSAINGTGATTTAQGKYGHWGVGYLSDGTYDVEFPSIMNPVAYRSEIPTKVSQLDNDAAYATAPVVTNIVRTIIATSGQYMWDEESSVCYRLHLHDGFIDLVAVTNINVNLPGNEEALLAVEEAWRNR